MNLCAGRASVALLGAVAVLIGCGAPDSDPEPPREPGPARADLEFVFRAGTSSSPKTVSLSCPPTDGASREACRRLAAVPPETFEPVPPGTACTELYGGPQTLRVTGRLSGAAIGSRFSRVNGCEISRWDSLSPVLRSLGLGEVGVAIPR